jgi:hypothetical protein
MLRTVNGHEVPGLKLRPSLFIDKTNVLYGASGTGKTVIVKNILKIIQGHIEQGCVVSPTEPSNRSYEGTFDPAFIHYRLFMPKGEEPPGTRKKKDTPTEAAIRFLTAIYQRQEMMAAIYTRANRIKILKSLFERLPHAYRKKTRPVFDKVDRQRRRVVNEIDMRHGGGSAGTVRKKKDEVGKKFEAMMVLMYKKFLTPYAEVLWKKKELSEDERYTLNYLHFNPRFVVVFDDCAADLKPLFKKEIFRRFFYQNRHVFLTVIICCQDDTDLDTNLRKNTFVSIFTSPVVASAYYGRRTNGYTKAQREYTEEIIPEVFDESIHRKMAYIREDKERQNFYSLQVEDITPTMFGSTALKELCNTVLKKETSMDTDNPYFESFRL